MKITIHWIVFLLIISVTPLTLAADGNSTPPAKEETPQFRLSEEMGTSMMREANLAKEKLQKQARSLFEREELGWGWETIDYLYNFFLYLPMKIPEITEMIMEQSRVLGFAGSIIMLTFIITVVYSFTGQKRVLALVEEKVKPYESKLTDVVYPYLLSTIKVLVAALIPLLLFGAFSLIKALIDYQAPWFQFAGRLLYLWVIGALIIGISSEALTQNLLPVAMPYGKPLFRLVSFGVLYVLGGIAIFWGAEAFQIRQDILALLRFVISVSIVVFSFLLMLKKRALLSLLPDLPYRSWEGFKASVEKYYYPIMFFTFLTALLWCLGYKRLGQDVMLKAWLTAGAFLVIMLAYHLLGRWLKKWQDRIDASDEASLLLIRSLKSILLYLTVLATIIIVFNLIGLLNPIQRLMSFPVLHLGVNKLTLWTIVQAVVILIAFVFASRLLQAYLDYKVYPSIGIDPGLAYALNTFLKYVSFVAGFLLSLKIVGIDLRFLLVFAGAIGIGIGLGLQNMAANVISGFSIIFGGKIRKDDWIEVGDTLGVVTDIYLNTTKVRTRDNIEHIIPNAHLISNAMVNYSLSSPMIRIDLLVGVAYDADPQKVKDILIQAGENEPLVSKFKKPAVRFIGYGDNSINFELLFWIDVRTTARRKVRSALYFAIFDALKKEGIEIPFPQRDIHIRSSPESSNLIKPIEQQR